MAEQKNDWVQNPKEPGIWRLQTDDPFTYGYVSQYQNGTYCWQHARGEHRISDIADTWEEATQAAESAMAMPKDDFAKVVVAEYIEELKHLEKSILQIAPATKLLPGYHAGYEAGQADLRKRIAEALE